MKSHFVLLSCFLLFPVGRVYAVLLFVTIIKKPIKYQPVSEHLQVVLAVMKLFCILFTFQSQKRTALFSSLNRNELYICVSDALFLTRSILSAPYSS